MDESRAELIAAAHALLAGSVSSDRRSRSEDPTDPATVQAMQLALNMPKVDPPSRNDVLVAAAQAVVGVCLSPNVLLDDHWNAALKNWYGYLIRKVARRARNKAWDDVQELPGVTATWETASVRAFIPSAVRDVPAPIAKLQIHGTEAEDLHPVVVDKRVPTIAVDTGLEMSVGKAAAQVGHASMLYAARLDSAEAVAWALTGFPLNVVEVTGAEFAEYVGRAGAVAVRDAGYTEVAPDSLTVVAVPPSA